MYFIRQHENGVKKHMDMQQLEKVLGVRYVKLHFGLRITEDTWLPMNKVSAIRDGIGEMLLRANCIRDRKCENCDFEPECIVRRTMYSKFDRRPDFVTTGDSVGYVLECEDYDEDFYEGDILECRLILFGKTIVYFSQFLQAFYQLGVAGVGKAHAHYEIVSVRNILGKELLDGDAVRMERFDVRTLWDYVEYRKRQKPVWENRICFKTPVTLKYQGQMQRVLTLEAVLPAVLRRIYMLVCFEGVECGNLRWDGSYPASSGRDFETVTVYWYSSTQNQKMPLIGTKGELVLSHMPENLLTVLLAGEVLHIGKNTSFGFGRYRVL